MTQFRKEWFGDEKLGIWRIEYCRDDGVDEWFDLFEDPSEFICDVLVEALQKANITIVDLDEKLEPGLPPTNLTHEKLSD